jgi:hypothetical protein
LAGLTAIWLAPLFPTTVAGSNGDILVGLMTMLFRILVISALAAGAALLFPEITRRVSIVIARRPAFSLLLGLVLAASILSLSALLMLTICLSLPGIAGILLLAAGMFLGWTALGMLTGRLLAGVLRWKLHPATATGFGALANSIMAALVGYIPCAGPVLVFAVLCLGLGGVAFALFGRHRRARVA